MESLLCFDLKLHNQEILGIGGLSDCGMVFSLANKRMREKTNEHRNIVLNRYSIIYLM